MGRIDKVASGTPQSPSPTGPVNDDSWETFIFAAYAADDSKLGAAAAIEATLCEQVASGVRQRFTVLSKTNILAWANDNVKANDTCRELKALLDSGTAQTDLPDNLLARLLKIRLLGLKAEGIEAKNSAKTTKEPIEIAVTPAEPTEGTKSKPTKKDDKVKEKETERAKSSIKKGAKGDPKKPEATSRPESAQIAPESSMRKTKLRERGVVKPDVKPTTIGDEPETGPDAYYLLRDFSGPGFFTCLMEENGVQVHLVLQVGGPTGTDTHGSRGANDGHKGHEGYHAARKTAHKAADTSLWKQVAFVSTNASGVSTTPPAAAIAANDGPSPPPPTIFDAVAATIYGMLRVRARYEEFYVSDRTITIPEVDGGRVVENSRFFAHLLRGVPDEWMVNNPDVLLSLVLEQVARTTPAVDLDAAVGEEGLGLMVPQPQQQQQQQMTLPEKAEEIAFLKQYFEHATKTLASAAPGLAVGASVTSASESEAVNRLANSLDEDISSVPISLADIHTQISRQIRSPNLVGLNMSSTLSQLRSRFAAGRAVECMRAFTERGEHGAGGAREQLVCASKLQTLVSAGGKIAHGMRVLRQDEFRNLVLGENAENMEKDQTNGLEDWRWIERFDEATFAQVLETALTTSSAIKAKFSDRESALLIALCSPGRVGQLQESIVHQSQARTRVGFGLFADLYAHTYLNPPPKATNGTKITPLPGTKDTGAQAQQAQQQQQQQQPQSQQYVYSTGDQLIGFEENMQYMYPDAGSYVKSRRVTSGERVIDASTTIVWGPNTLSYRVPPPPDCESTATNPTATGATLTATLGDELCFSFALHADGTMQAQASTADGLVVSWSGDDGTITQRATAAASVGPRNLPPSAQSGEVGRAVRSDGTVIRYLCSGETQILFPSGNVSTYTPTNSTWTSINASGQLLTTSSSNCSTSTIHISEERDLASKTSITTRGDMVQVVRHANGEVTAKHADGTVIATTGEGGVEVVSIGFAGVVLKGGNSTVEFENGAVFERVKDGAHVEFRIRKGDDLFVVASDGTAQVTPAYRHPAAIAPVGVHVLDWANGTLGTEDAGGTRFSVDKSGNCMVKPPASKTDSPSPPSTSTVSKPPKLTRTIPHTVRETLIKHVTSPSTPIRNSPRLFVLHTDGYGHELLRDADLVSFLKDATRKSAAGQGVWIMEEPLVDARESVGVTVIVGRMDEEDGNAGGIVQGAVQYRQLIRHPRLSSPAITALVSEYNELDSILSAPDNTLSNAPPIDETCEQVSAELCASLKPSPSMSNQTAHYGLSREETEARIKARYALREESAMAVGTSPQQNMENRGDADDGAASSRLVAPTKPLRAIVPVPPAATASTTMASLSTAPSTAVSGSVAAGSASSSITNNNNGSSRRKRRSLHRMLNDAEIPRYFDSPEGRARFSEAPPVSIPPPTTTATETSPPHFSSLHHPTTPSTGASSSPPTTAPAPTHNDRQQQADSPQRASSPLKTDVLGRPRRSKLQLPSVLRSSKGGAVPNAEYAAVENSARRTVKTSSTAGLKDEAALNSLGTFEIYPSRINFGTIVVQPGGSTATGVGGGGKASLHLVNVGNCAARFKVVKQQKQNSWIETSFTPGPVAPGMKVDIHLKLTPNSSTIADSATGSRSGTGTRVVEELKIVTEAHIFTVACTANVIFEAISSSSTARYEQSTASL